MITLRSAEVMHKELPDSARVNAPGQGRPREHADVAQLVEHHLAKVRVAGSNPVVRSEGPSSAASHWWSGREARQRPAKPCTRVQIPSPPLVSVSGD